MYARLSGIKGAKQLPFLRTVFSYQFAVVRGFAARGVPANYSGREAGNRKLITDKRLSENSFDNAEGAPLQFARFVDLAS